MILITGATGNNGQELVRQLAAAGQPVRALVRNPSKPENLKSPNVELATGDTADGELIWIKDKGNYPLCQGDNSLSAFWGCFLPFLARWEHGKHANCVGHG